MSSIEPRTCGRRIVKYRMHLDRVDNATLYAAAHVLHESTEYVLNQVIDSEVAGDEEVGQSRAG